MGDRIIITEGETLEIKIMIGTGVGHMRDRIETEGMIEALVTASLRSGSRATTNRDRTRCLSVGNMTILQETV